MARRRRRSSSVCQELKLKERAATEKSIEIKLLVVFDQIRVGKRYVHAGYIYYEASPSSGGVMNHILTPLLTPSVPRPTALRLRLSPYIHSSTTSDPSLEPTPLAVVTSFTLDTSVYSFTTILPTYIPRQTPRRPGYPPGTLSSSLSHPYTTNRLSRISHIISTYGTRIRTALDIY